MTMGAEQVHTAAEPRGQSVDPQQMPAELRRVFTAFAEAGHGVWLMGPAARELVLGRTPDARHYAEFVTSAPRKAATAIAGRLAVTDGQDLGTTRRGWSWEAPSGPDGPRRIQLSQLRTSLPPYRTLRALEVSGLELDLATREITLHAFVIDADGQVTDPHGGVADLRARRIRTILPPDKVFCESGMYLLKVARYVAQYDFEPAPDLVRFAARDAGNILDTPRNQWKEHLDRVLLGPGVIAGLQFLYDSRTLQFLMPEVASMVGFHESCPVHHKDIWDHTVKVIAKAEKNLVVRWAALMHDIGKVWTRQVTKQGKVHFFRHEELGALLFEGVAFRLRFDQESMNRVAYVIRNHSRVNLYEDNWTDSAIRRLMRDVGDYLPDLIAFSKADFTTKRAWREAELKRQMAELEQRIAAIREEDSRVPPLPSGLGNEMMGRFGLTPGPRIGELKRLLEAAIKDGTLAPYQESAVYLDWLAANASL